MIDNNVGCYTPHLGVIGYFVNGIAMYAWSDGDSYNSAGVRNAARIVFIDVGCSIYHTANYCRSGIS
jgi:hypothetical protein